jgi:hypothetical protein
MTRALALLGHALHSDMLARMRFEMPAARAALHLAQAGVTLNGALSARISGTIDEDRLRDALARLAERYPLAATRVAEGDNGRPAFTTEGVSPFPLFVVDRTSDTTWLSELTREIQVPIGYLTGPLLRSQLARGSNVSELTLIGEHLTADGRSLVNALRDLLTLLADPSIALPPVMPRRLADLVPPDVVERSRRQAAARSAQDPEGDRPAESWPDAGVTARPPLDVSVHRLSSEQTAVLASRCHDEGVTVQAALCAAFLMPFAEQNPGSPVRRAEVPVDLRPRLSEPLDDIYGNLISMAMVDLEFSPGRPLWDMAHDAATALAAASRKDALFAAPMIAMQLSDLPRPPGRRRPWGTDYDVSISNLGRIGIPDRIGPFTIESISPPIFPASGPNHRIVGVSTFAGQMQYSFSCRSPEARGLLERGGELLLEMVA